MRFGFVTSRLGAVALAALVFTGLIASAAVGASGTASTARPDVYPFGRASFYGSTGATRLANPIVGMASTPSGRGYWLVASDGGMFSFGDARIFGSTGGLRLNRPIVGMASTSTGHGYWLASADGRVFGYGDAAKFVRAAAARARSIGIASGVGASVVGIATSPGVRGFWLAADGGAGRRAEDAIAWFEAREGSSSYEHRCETAVELAYGTINRYPTARADWLAQAELHRDWWNAPRGALVYCDTSSDGHVAISLGNGQIVSTSINGRIAVAPIGFLENPVGWAAQPW